jgi:hypothetical protein
MPAVRTYSSASSVHEVWATDTVPVENVKQIKDDFTREIAEAKIFQNKNIP